MPYSTEVVQRFENVLKDDSYSLNEDDTSTLINTIYNDITNIDTDNFDCFNIDNTCDKVNKMPITTDILKNINTILEANKNSLSQLISWSMNLSETVAEDCGKDGELLTESRKLINNVYNILSDDIDNTTEPLTTTKCTFEIQEIMIKIETLKSNLQNIDSLND